MFDRTEISTQFVAQSGADGLLVVMFVNCNAGTQASYKLSMVFENFDEANEPYHVGSGDKQLPPLFASMTLLYIIASLACGLHMLRR